jgi:methylmalonyl-CoA decarboxylase subunit alpha
MTILEERPKDTDPGGVGGRPPATSSAVARLERYLEQARTAPDGGDGTERQHARGKLTVRERIDLLVDKDSFTEIETLRRHRATGFGMDDRHPPTDGVVTGWAAVDGRTVVVVAHDFRVFGGSLGEAHAEKIHKAMDLAESGGVRRSAGPVHRRAA